MERARAVFAAALLVLLVAMVAGPAAASADPVPEPPASSSAPTPPSTSSGTTELARTGPEDGTARLGAFGFLLIGTGLVTLVVSRRLFALEGDRR